MKLKHNGRYKTAKGEVVTVVHADYVENSPHWSGYEYWCPELQCWYTNDGAWKMVTPFNATLVEDVGDYYDWPCWL